MLRTLSLWLVLFILWLLLSGYFDTPLLLACGALSCALTVAIVRRAHRLDPEELHLDWYLNRRLLRYVPWLLLEIVTANIDVARRILDPRLPISPVLLRLRPGQRGELGQVIYANSITLTPGTVTTYLSENQLEVHALTAAAAATLQQGEMDRRVSALEDLN